MPHSLKRGDNVVNVQLVDASDLGIKKYNNLFYFIADSTNIRFTPGKTFWKFEIFGKKLSLSLKNV